MTNYDWANELGDQWLSGLSNWEATLKPFDTLILNFIKSKIEAAPSREISNVADVACGGGGTTFAIESILPNNTSLHGFDISSALVNTATIKAESIDSRAIFSVSNLETASAPMQAYDLLISRFGIMFFNQPATAFSNLKQWLKPKGLFVFLVWGESKYNP